MRLTVKGIDAHQHFWKFDSVRYDWIDDNMKSIRKDFLPHHLQPLLAQNNFDGCVAVQANQSEEETRFLIGLAKQHDFIKGVVGWVDLRAVDISERLAYYKQEPVVKGFRHVLQSEIERDFMLQPSFKRGINQLQLHGFVYDILIFPDQLNFSAELVASFPNQKFVIDHIAKPMIRHKEISIWRKDIEKMASNDNVYCKISGLVTEADWQNWKPADFIEYIHTVVNAFGIDRVMFGSDWPVCQVAASYEEVVGITEEYFSAFSEADQAKFFRHNAVHFYNL